MSFKEDHRDLQELVRELFFLHKHNKDFKEGDRQGSLLLFAEGAVVLLTLERFLRIIPALKATEEDTLFNLLERATSKSVLVLPSDDQKTAVRSITTFSSDFFSASSFSICLKM